MTESDQRNKTYQKRSLFVPLALIAIALVGSLSGDIYQEWRRNAVLVQRNAQLDASVRDSHNVRGQFDVLVKGIAGLAQAGNPNAAPIADALKSAGVSIRTTASE